MNIKLNIPRPTDSALEITIPLQLDLGVLEPLEEPKPISPGVSTTEIDVDEVNPYGLDLGAGGFAFNTIQDLRQIVEHCVQQISLIEDDCISMRQQFIISIIPLLNVATEYGIITDYLINFDDLSDDLAGIFFIDPRSDSWVKWNFAVKASEVSFDEVAFATIPREVSSADGELWV